MQEKNSWKCFLSGNGIIMNIRYKLTTQDLTTYNYTKWVLNEWKETSGTGKLCTEGWLHCYTSPLLAILLNPIHASQLFLENIS